MEICKAPTLRLKALNKHNITQIMYIEMKTKFSNYKKEEKEKLTHNVDINSGITMQKMHMHTHAHTRTHARTHYTDW